MKPDLPQTGGSFVRDDKGKLTRTGETPKPEKKPAAKPVADKTEG